MRTLLIGAVILLSASNTWAATYFALVSPDSTVEQVIVANQRFIDGHLAKDFLSGAKPCGNGCSWVETFMDGSKRKRYAGKGGIYDKHFDAFIPRRPYKAWVMDENTLLWKAPVSAPQDGKRYVWDDEKDVWKEDAK